MLDLLAAPWASPGRLMLNNKFTNSDNMLVDIHTKK